MLGSWLFDLHNLHNRTTVQTTPPLNFPLPDAGYYYRCCYCTYCIFHSPPFPRQIYLKATAGFGTFSPLLCTHELN